MGKRSLSVAKNYSQKIALEVLEGRFSFGQGQVSHFPPFRVSMVSGCCCFPDSHASGVSALDFSARKPNVSSKIRSRRRVVWFGAHVVSITSSVDFLVAAAPSHQWGRCMTVQCCPLLDCLAACAVAVVAAHRDWLVAHGAVDMGVIIDHAVVVGGRVGNNAHEEGDQRRIIYKGKQEGRVDREEGDGARGGYNSGGGRLHAFLAEFYSAGVADTGDPQRGIRNSRKIRSRKQRAEACEGGKTRQSYRLKGQMVSLSLHTPTYAHMCSPSGRQL